MPCDSHNKEAVESCFRKEERVYVQFTTVYEPDVIHGGREGKTTKCKVPAGLLDGRLDFYEVYHEPNNYQPKEHVALVMQQAQQVVVQADRSKESPNQIEASDG